MLKHNQGVYTGIQNQDDILRKSLISTPICVKILMLYIVSSEKEKFGKEPI